jgi:hypothetical protein
MLDEIRLAEIEKNARGSRSDGLRLAPSPAECLELVAEIRKLQRALNESAANALESCRAAYKEGIRDQKASEQFPKA